jgi:hypothetical protein
MKLLIDALAKFIFGLIFVMILLFVPAKIKYFKALSDFIASFVLSSLVKYRLIPYIW